MNTLKKVHYEGCGPYNPLNEVAYRIYGRQIVFTGLHDGRDGARGSTINFAEEIISAIAQAEHINPRKHLFYDLQTRRGYTDHRPGDYTFNELRPRWSGVKPVGMGWQEGHCDPRVIEDFVEFIWGEYPRGEERNLPVCRGALKPLPPDTEQPRLTTGTAT